jgi:arylsulfatase A-like enzyme
MISGRAQVALLMGMLLLCEPAVGWAEPASAPPQPSILLIVLDTVRADSVSSYGSVKGTTPTIDGLADDGIRYRTVFSASPWTLPSHASIFTGRGIEEHRVGMPGHPVLTDRFKTLAESLDEVAYETVAISENAIVSDLFQLLRGFETRVTTSLTPDDEKGFIHQDLIDASAEFQKWAGARDRNRPFFVFVNILDAHRPYDIRAKNPWVPNDASDTAIQDRFPAPERLICGALPTPEQIAIQKGLYLGDVHAADRKVARIVERARSMAGPGRLITIVTSDHGELFGEHELMGHEFSLHSSLLRVPLVVHGIGASKHVVVDVPVSLEDIMPSVLEWVGVEVPDDLSGSILPLGVKSEPRPKRIFFSAYSDRFLGVPPTLKDRVQPKNKDALRKFCAPTNQVWGGMAALIRYPFKYVWYEKYSPVLYDLSWDSQEISDQSFHKTDLVESFEKQMRSMRESAGLEANANSVESGLSIEAIEALKMLGYVE